MDKQTVDEAILEALQNVTGLLQEISERLELIDDTLSDVTKTDQRGESYLRIGGIVKAQ